MGMLFIGGECIFQMRESEYVTQIIAELEKIGAKAVKFVETEYSEIGTPDIIGCFSGLTFLIEVKIADNTTSKIQNLRLQEWAKAGAITIVVTHPLDSAFLIAMYIRNVWTELRYESIDWQADFESFILENG